MGYTPTLDDIDNIDEDSSYSPSLSDINEIDKNESSKNVSNLINQVENLKESNKAPLMQEKYSNPTAMPGFENLSPQEKQQQIAFSQFDPANQTPTGGYVPPGTYESNQARLAASMLPTAFQPEFEAGNGLLSRYVTTPALNALSRIGTGTASNIAYQLPNIKSMQDLQDVAKQSAALNSMLEAPTLAVRGPAYMAEMMNPLKYGKQKATDIKNELSATEAVMEEMYKPINEKYGNSLLTLTPKKFLKDAGVKRNNLYPDAKIIYDDFMSNPNYMNLHRLQSKIGKDWARSSKNPATEEKAQLFSQMRDSLQNKKKNFLSRDENALNQLNKADEFSKNQYYPYFATPTLRNIAKGNIDVDTNLLAKSIKKGTEKTVGKSDMKLIPEDHPLRNHLQDLNKIANFGKAVEGIVPPAIGALAGETIYPGWGALGGAAAGAGLEKYLSPTMFKITQNPLLEKFMKNINPLYYGLGRSALSVFNENR